ncbi:ABC transporter substrate-binding protein [Clostridium nigeriense]|uniref:ABC transporter substrate-binding protein n=1 Tax=Clostridium nigeriense TaxID=1805470 RepID=UPI003D339916
MKKLKNLTAILLSVMLILVLVSCGTGNQEKANDSSNGQVQSNDDSHYPVTITTYNYSKEPVELIFYKAPEKVVAIYQNSIETMLALGLEDKIVAAAGLDHDVKDEYKEAFSKINYLEEFTPSKETIIMEEPDFILGWYSLFDNKRLGDIDYWNESGVNTYISLNSGAAKERTIENEITDILNIGKIFNVEDKAQAIVDNITSTIKEVSEKVSSEEKQSAMVVEFYDEDIYTYGSKTLAGDMLTQLGAEILNPEGGNIGAEDLIKLNPDCIFVSYMDRGDENIALEEVNKVLNNPAFASLSAVKNGRVYAIPLGDMYSSGIRTIDGINTFASGLYGNE